MELVINGMRIHYIDQGTGPTVLMLHGWGSGVDVWAPFLAMLSHDLRFVALDFPGCGQSDLPDHPLTTDDYADLVMQFIRALDLKDFAMVGHSHGGRVIMKMAGSGMVKPTKIVFLDAAGIKPKKSFKKSIKVATYKTVRRLLTLPFIRNYTADLLNKARAHFGSSDYNNAPEVMRKTLVNLVNDDMTDLLPNIACPTFLIWGDRDTATPLYMAHILEEKIADTGLAVFEGTGHFSFLEQPGRAAAILKSFLAE